MMLMNHRSIFNSLTSPYPRIYGVVQVVFLLSFFLYTLSGERIINLPEDPAPKMENYDAFSERDALSFFDTDTSSRIVGNNATRTAQGHLRSIIASYMSIPNDVIWERVKEVSLERPYFFFHARKAGGSTLRGDLYLAAKSLQLPAYIVCEMDEEQKRVPCDTYTIPNDKLYAVYAGHYQWGEQKKVERISQQHFANTGQASIRASEMGKDSYFHFSHSGKTLEERDKLPISCMTNLREPVSRILSCINYRYLRFHGKFTNATCISDIPVEELYHLLAEEVDDFSNSCLNEPFRVFSGLRDEDAINALGLEFKPSIHVAVPSLNHLGVDMFRQTLLRYAQCVPYILELPKQSGDLLAYKFPKLYTAGAYRMDVASNVEKTKCSGARGKPTPEQLKLLEQMAAYERVLYEAISRKQQQAYRELMIRGDVRSAVTNTQNQFLRKSHDHEWSGQAKQKPKPRQL